jgi:hypothetical protein
MATQMGLGLLGSAENIFKRKFRWTMEFITVCGISGLNIAPSFVKAANRPSLTIEETEINFLNGKMWIPGKGTPDTTQVTYYDVASIQGGDVVSSLFTWLATVYNFTDPIGLSQSSKSRGQGGYCAEEGKLNMLDGCGVIIDTFVYQQCWPTQMNFGELDYSSNDECTIDVTLRYKNFKYIPSDAGCAKNFDIYCAGCGPKDKFDKKKPGSQGNQTEVTGFEVV